MRNAHQKGDFALLSALPDEQIEPTNIPGAERSKKDIVATLLIDDRVICRLALRARGTPVNA